MKWVLILGIAGLLTCGSTLADNEPDTSQLPAPVRQAINEWKGEGEVKKVKTRRGPNGTVYEVEYKERGDEKEIVIAEDGTVLSESEGKGKGKGKDKKENKKKDQKKDKDNKDRDDDAEVIPPSAGSTNKPPPGAISRRPTSRRNPDSPVIGQPPVASGEEPRRVAFEKIPQKVQSAIVSQKRLGAPKHVESQTKKGKTLYHATFERGNLSYTPEGLVVKAETYWK